DAAGNPLDGLSVDPVAVKVSVPVLPIATTRTVPILWAIRGAVANGFWLSRVAVDPPAVTVRGATSALGALDHLETAPIDVTGLNANRTSRVGILLPDGITLLRPVDATVTLTVIPLSGTRPFPSVAIVVANLGQGLAADVDQQTAAVLLAGPLPVLAATDQISPVVDALGGPGHSVLIGRDTRRSGRMLEGALAAGLCSVGMEVRLVGHVPTPGLAFLAKTNGYVAGVVISASHNPAPDNGIKFFDHRGLKLPDRVEDEIEKGMGDQEALP